MSEKYNNKYKYLYKKYKHKYSLLKNQVYGQLGGNPNPLNYAPQKDNLPNLVPNTLYDSSSPPPAPAPPATCKTGVCPVALDAFIKPELSAKPSPPGKK